MKQQTKTLFTPLTEIAMKTLCNEIKETNISGNELRKFSVVDLWHIQKNMKLSGCRRSLAI